ncbi:hypothetical protein DXG01_008176 [Tephrocybe rancida]|nr:hypothetical protein DXG01_008176 [Tephrocybe rancida]
MSSDHIKRAPEDAEVLRSTRGMFHKARDLRIDGGTFQVVGGGIYNYHNSVHNERSGNTKYVATTNSNNDSSVHVQGPPECGCTPLLSSMNADVDMEVVDSQEEVDDARAEGRQPRAFFGDGRVLDASRSGEAERNTAPPTPQERRLRAAEAAHRRILGFQGHIPESSTLPPSSPSPTASAPTPSREPSQTLSESSSDSSSSDSDSSDTDDQWARSRAQPRNARQRHPPPAGPSPNDARRATAMANRHAQSFTGFQNPQNLDPNMMFVAPRPQPMSRNPFAGSSDADAYGVPEMDMQNKTGTPRKTWASVYEAEELEGGMAG